MTSNNKTIRLPFGRRNKALRNIHSCFTREGVDLNLKIRWPFFLRKQKEILTEKNVRNKMSQNCENIR